MHLIKSNNKLFSISIVLGISIVSCVKHETRIINGVKIESIHYSNSTGCLFGFVVDSNGLPIENVEIQIKSSNISITARTNVLGRYVFNDLQPGSYIVIARKEGLTPVKYFEPVSVVANNASHLMLALRPGKYID